MRNRVQPEFRLRRLSQAGNLHLPVFDIQIVRAAEKAA